MKKLICIFLSILLISFLNSCAINDSKYINFSLKPNNYHYTNEIKNKIMNNENFTVYVFDTNLYKEIEVSSAENYIIKNFIDYLNSENYSDEIPNTKEPYRIKIIFEDKSQYLFRIFDNSTISISPWDGKYDEDIISIKDFPLRYNPFDFCNHITNKPISK